MLPSWRQVFFGTHHCYVFMRLHHTLYTRLALARDLAHAEVTRALGDTPAAAAAASSSSSEGNGHGHGQGQPGAALYSASAPMEVEGEADVVPTGKGRPTVTKKHTLPAAQVRGAYQAFLGQLFALVDGGIDAARYEEQTLLPLPQASPSLKISPMPLPHSHFSSRLSLPPDRLSHAISSLTHPLPHASPSLTRLCRYEESCRQLLGNHAYVLYTLDKVVQQTLKCLQAMINDDNINKLVGLFVYYRSKDMAAITARPDSSVAAVQRSLAEVQQRPSLHPTALRYPAPSPATRHAPRALSVLPRADAPLLPLLPLLPRLFFFAGPVGGRPGAVPGARGAPPGQRRHGGRLPFAGALSILHLSRI